MMDHTSPTSQHHLWTRLTLRLGLLVLGGGLCWWLVPPLLSLFAPFLLAMLVAALLNPSIRYFQRKLGWGRGIFTLLMLGGLVAGLGGGVVAILYVAGNQLVALLSDWEKILAQMNRLAEAMDRWMEAFWLGVPPALSSWVDTVYLRGMEWLQGTMPQLVEEMASRAGQAMGQVPLFLLALLIFLLATYFIAADYPYLKGRLVGRLDEEVIQFGREVHQTALAAFGGYLRAQFLLSVGVFFILLAGFFVVGQPYGVLISLGLAVLDFIPILGAGTVMIPWAFGALFTGAGVAGAEIIIIWVIVALFRRGAEPKFVGNQTGLSPILSLMSIYVGFRVSGVLGMIFAPILVLIGVNLVGLGLFSGLVRDCVAAVRQLSAFLKEGE